MSKQLGYRYAAVIVAATLLALLVAALSIWTFQQTEAAADARQITYATILRGNTLLSNLRDAETGQRGFALTGDEKFLEPYLAVREHIASELREMRALPVSAAAVQRLDAMAPLVDAKMAELAKVIA